MINNKTVLIIFFMIMRTVMLKKKKNSPTFLDLKKKIYFRIFVIKKMNCILKINKLRKIIIISLWNVKFVRNTFFSNIQFHFFFP